MRGTKTMGIPTWGAAWWVTASLVAAATVVACKDEPAGGAAGMASAAAAKWAASASAPAAPPPPPEKPHTRVVLAKLHQPKGLALAGKSLYVVDSVGGDKDKGTELLDLVRIPTDPPDVLPTEDKPIATKQHGLGSPLVVKDDLYLTVASDRPGEDRLVKMPLAGGPMKTVATGLVPGVDPGIATDGTSLFYLAVVKGAGADKAGKPPAPDAPPAPMDVMRLPIAGGKAVRLGGAKRSARLLFVAADAHDVYFPEAGRVARVPIAGGDPVDVVKVVYPWAAVSDGKDLFFSDSPGENTGSLKRVPVAAGAPAAKTLASGFSFPVSIALSDTSVFFLDFDADDGALYRVARDGGIAVPLVQGQKHPSHVLVDGGAVYWTSSLDGTVCKTTP